MHMCIANSLATQGQRVREVNYTRKAAPDAQFVSLPVGFDVIELEERELIKLRKSTLYKLTQSGKRLWPCTLLSLCYAFRLHRATGTVLGIWM